MDGRRAAEQRERLVQRGRGGTLRDGQRAVAILALASYHKGQEFLREAKRLGSRVLLLTVENLADARGEDYMVEAPRSDFAGVIVTLARQEWPDITGYTDPEIVWRLRKRHHVGLIVASADRSRVESLLESYVRRFGDDFHASMPAAAEALE